MIQIENTLVSEDLINIKFCCDLPKCKGICCIEGDAGAPLQNIEIGMIDEVIELIKPYMDEAGLDALEQDGIFDYDEDGEFVTTLKKNGPCTFVYYENDIAFCAIERAFLDEKISFRKPISCFLYPVRLKKLSNETIAVNYQKWHICDDALVKGKNEGVPLYVFLKDSLIEKFGQKWYDELLIAVENNI